MDQYLTLKEAGAALNISSWKILQLIEAGDLRALQVSRGSRKRTLRIRRTDIDSFVTERLTAAAPAGSGQKTKG